METEAVQVRRARRADHRSSRGAPRLWANVHVAIDPRRFVAPDAAACHQFFEAELERTETVMLVAESDTASVGYAFVRLEPGNLVLELRETGAYLHDIFVVPEVRSHGVGRRLVDAAFAAAREQCVSRYPGASSCSLYSSSSS